jgi:hypothetical protein
MKLKISMLFLKFNFILMILIKGKLKKEKTKHLTLHKNSL